LIFIGSQLLLTPRQLLQLLKRLVDVLLAAIAGGLLAGFVLILLAVQFQISQVLEIAAHAAAATATTTLVAKRDLYVAERSFGA